jgi:uncharacterized protein (TIRG00374 family)
MSEQIDDQRAELDATGFPRPDELLRSRFFAVPAGAARDRRPTDVTMLVATVVALTLFAIRAGSPTGGFEASVIELVDRLPTFLDPLWRVAHDALLVWAVVLVVITLLRRQWGLARDLVFAVALAFAVAAAVGRLAKGSWPDLFDAITGTDGPVDYPAAGLALAVSIASVASSHLSRPYRYFGRWLIVGGGISSVAIGITSPGGAFGAVSLGLAAAAAVHLIVGSPGGLPSLRQVHAAMAGIGVDAEPLDVSRRSGVVQARAVDNDGSDLRVKVYGRDAWDGQLVVSVWRFLWYREQGPTLTLTRLQQVEHEAFITLLAERRGALVDPVVAAGADSIGDALLVVRRIGQPLSELAPTLVATTDATTDATTAVATDATTAAADAAWQSLELLHRAGIAHGTIDADRLLFDGSVARFADLGSSMVGASAQALLVDRAQLLVTLAAHFGTEVAVASALTALGGDGLLEVSSVVQPAALSSTSRRQVSAAKLDVDDVRAAVVAATGGQQRDLQRLRRLTIGRVLMAVLLFFAASRLVTGLLEIGLDTIWDALRDANFAIVVFAFCISLISRPATALGLTALTPVKVPFGRLTILQFAMSFVNLAMPSTAGRVAVNIRFFQRNGVDPTTAVAIGAIDSFSGFIAQMIMIGSVLLFGLGSLDLNIDDAFSMDKVASLLWMLAIAAVVAIAVVALVPKLRRYVLDALTKLREFLGPFLRSPGRVATTIGANLISELVGAMVLLTVLAAFGQSVSVPDVILVSVGVGLFSGLMPVPGGIGVAEAALTAGFIAVGVPDATAFAAALTCRMVTYYTPPIPGWFALRWMQRRHYL